MLRLLVLGVGGAAGAISRYLLDGLIQSSFGPLFPWGTLTINLLGCLALGFLATLADEKFLLNPALRTGLFIGFLGAFTTFSTFAYETWMLFKDSQYFMASCNVFLNVAGGFAGLLFGIFAARTL